MTTIVTRAGKGSPLTHTEVDTNFTNLNTAKLETAAIPLGTLQAPSVSFLNDSDTGIFCPQGGNSLAIATGGQYAISCTSTQAVGIKTANPQKTLHVAGSTRVGADDATDAFLEIGEGATGNRNSYIDIVGDTTYTDYGVRLIRNNTGANATSEIKHRGTGNFNITTQEASAIEFSTSNTPRVTITSGGLVGLGNSSPSSYNASASDLVVGNHTGAHGVTICSQNNSSGYIMFSDGTTGAQAYAGQITYDHTNNRLTLGTNDGTTGLTVDSSQRVGIGSTGPSGKLDVETASDTYVNFSTTNNGSAAGICILGNNNNEFFGYANNLRFATVTGKNAAGFNERMRMDSSGRLLVGTSSGSGTNLLQIQGSTAGSAGIGGIALRRGVAPSGMGEGSIMGYLDFGPNDGGIGCQIVGVADGTQGTNDYPGRLVFSTTADGAATPTERMRIKSDGDVSIVTGNLIIGTSGKGIDFSADSSAAGMTSELLDDYEEGTWTPAYKADTTDPTVTYGSINLGKYTKIGRIVHIQVTIQSTQISTAGSGDLFMGGLPFTPQTDSYGGYSSMAVGSNTVVPLNASERVVVAVDGGVGKIRLVRQNDDTATDTVLTGAIFPIDIAVRYLFFSGSYLVA